MHPLTILFASVLGIWFRLQQNSHCAGFWPPTFLNALSSLITIDAIRILQSNLHLRVGVKFLIPGAQDSSSYMHYTKPCTRIWRERLHESQAPSSALVIIILEVAHINIELFLSLYASSHTLLFNSEAFCALVYIC